MKGNQLACAMVWPRPLARLWAHKGIPSPTLVSGISLSPGAQGFHSRGSYRRTLVGQDAQAPTPGSDQKTRLPSETNLEGDKFYEYYLSCPLPLHPFRPAADLRHLNSEAAKDAVPDRFKSNPLAVFTDKTTSVETAAVCLEGYIANLGSQRLPRSETRDHYAMDKPSTRALLWLFE